MPNLSEARLRHAAHYERAARATQALYLQGGESINHGLDLFELEWRNIQAGQAWAEFYANVRVEAATLCSAYPDAGLLYLDLRQPPRERIRWLESGLSAATRLHNLAAQAAHLGNLAVAFKNSGEFRRAVEHSQKAIALAQKLGDRQGEGAALDNLGIAYRNVSMGIGHCGREFSVDRRCRTSRSRPVPAG